MKQSPFQNSDKRIISGCIRSFLALLLRPVGLGEIQSVNSWGIYIAVQLEIWVLQAMVHYSRFVPTF